MIPVFTFLLGSIVGSFLNVCIYRLPLDRDVIFKPSECTKCAKKIKWYQNIPIISFIFLKGKCGSCKEKISLQYPIVELITAVSFLFNFSIYGTSLNFIFATIFTTSLILIFFTDFKDFLIFDAVTLPVTLIGFVVSLVVYNPFNVTFLNSIIGACTGYSIIFFIRWFYLKFKGVEGMGLGDAKLFLMIGAWLGIHSLLFILLFSSVAGSIFGGAMILLGKNKRYTHIPYGCFIVVASFGYLFFGEIIYNSLF